MVSCAGSEDRMKERWLWFWLCGVLFVRGEPCRAQRLKPPPAKPPATVGASTAVPASTAETLRRLGARAGVIFVGRVVEVRRYDAAGYVDVVFHIEQGVRGAATGGDYVLREWSGLWVGVNERYPVGKRLLLLLSARGPSGMSSPVGGITGVLPLIAVRQPPLLHGAAAPPPYTEEEATVGEAVDLRWVESAGVRETTAPEHLSRDTQEPANPVRTRARNETEHEADRETEWSGPVAPMLKRRVGPNTEGPSLTAVLALLETRLAP